MKPSEIRDKISKDFDPFWEAVKDELVRHYPEKGDSWKKDETIIGYYHRYSSMPSPPIYQDMIEYLENLEQDVHQKYRRSKEPDELLDKTALNAMIWLKKKGFVTITPMGENFF